MHQVAVRINKFLANRGVCSRRKADRWVKLGKVAINGQTVTEPGTKVSSDKDKVTVEGREIKDVPAKVYYAVYKPVGYVSSLSDPEKRPLVGDLVPPLPRVYPVGRLDVASEGLIILTNDGAVTDTLTHPKHHLPKTYRVKLDRKPTGKGIRRLRQGIRLKDGPVQPAKVKAIDTGGPGYWYEITIYEGRNKQVRRMFKAIGSKVEDLIRTKIGSLGLGSLNNGSYRILDVEEIKNIFLEQ